MAEIVPPHNHCIMCMKSIPVGETLCSDECRKKYQARLKKQKLSMLFLWAIVIAFIVVLLVYQ